MRRSVILTLELPRGHEDGILALLVDLCDHVEKWKQAALIEGYGLGLVVPQYAIKELPTHVIHVDKEADEEEIPTGDFPEADILSEDEEPAEDE